MDTNVVTSIMFNRAPETHSDKTDTILENVELMEVNELIFSIETSF
jgi:hypothetical protein